MEGALTSIRAHERLRYGAKLQGLGFSRTGSVSGPAGWPAPLSAARLRWDGHDVIHVASFTARAFQKLHSSFLGVQHLDLSKLVVVIVFPFAGPRANLLAHRELPLLLFRSQAQNCPALLSHCSRAQVSFVALAARALQQCCRQRHGMGSCFGPPSERPS